MTRRALLALAGALLPGCAVRPRAFVVDDEVVEEGDLRVRLTRVSDAGPDGLVLGGLVTDAETEGPVSGLNVLVEGTERGATAGPDGRFVIGGLRPDQTLRFQFIGYRTLRAPVGELVGRREAGVPPPDR